MARGPGRRGRAESDAVSSLLLKALNGVNRVYEPVWVGTSRVFVRRRINMVGRGPVVFCFRAAEGANCRLSGINLVCGLAIWLAGVTLSVRGGPI